MPFLIRAAEFRFHHQSHRHVGQKFIDARRRNVFHGICGICWVAGWVETCSSVSQEFFCTLTLQQCECAGVRLFLFPVYNDLKKLYKQEVPINNASK